MAHLQKVCSASIAGFGPLPLSDTGNTFKPSGQKRDHKPACKPADGGYTSANTPAELEVSLNAKKTLSLQAVGSLADVVVTVKTSNGVVHVMSSAWCEEIPQLGDDGTAKAKFVSNESTEMSA